MGASRGNRICSIIRSINEQWAHATEHRGGTLHWMWGDVKLPNQNVRIHCLYSCIIVKTILNVLYSGLKHILE